MSREPGLRKLSLLAYTRAYTRQPQWRIIFSDEILQLIESESFRIYSNETNVLICFINAIAASIGKNGKIKTPPNGSSLYLNTYLLLIARSGAGKTSALNHYLIQPMKRISQQIKSNIIFQECTPAGLISRLNENAGSALLASDESCPRLCEMIARQGDRTNPMRSSLNTFYSGYGTEKVFATKQNIEFNDVYFGIIGTTQPHPFIIFLKELISIDDGLADRFFCIASPPAPIQTPPVNNPPTPDDWILKVLLRIAELHSKQSPILYEFSIDAGEFYEEIRAMESEHSLQVYKELEQSVASAVLPDDDAVREKYDRKVIEYIAKLATLIHITKHALEAVVNGSDLRSFDIPSLVQKSALEAAIELVTKMQIHRNEFLSFIDNHSSYDQYKVAKQILEKKNKESIEKLILLYDYPVVTVNMLTRKYNHLRQSSLEIRQEMIRMGSATPGQPKFIGKYKRVNKNVDAFYKEQWNHCDQEYLKSLGISEEAYAKAFQADTSKAPVNALSPNWSKYWSKIMSEKPDMNSDN